MKFLVLGGKHYENGLCYAKDDVVESDHNLEEVFQNKFRRLGDDVPVTPKDPTAMSVKLDVLAKKKAKARAENPDDPANLIGTTKENVPPKKDERKPKLYARHAGAGRYNVCRVDNDEKITDELLDKAEAEAMVNA